MTDTNDQTPEREGRKRRGGLFVYDTEICERLNLPAKEGLRFIRAIESRGFPPPIEALNNRRYWPAVKAFFDKNYGLPEAPQKQQWVRPVQRRSA
jgi:hypothetical protein